MDESEIAVIVKLDEWIGSSLLYHKFKYQTTELQLFLQHVPALHWYPLDMMIGTSTSRIELSDCVFNAAVRNPLHYYSTKGLLVEMINILLETEDDYDEYESNLLTCIEKLKTTDFQSFEKRKLKRLIVELVEVLKDEIKEPFQEEDQDCILIDNPLNDNEEFVLKTVKQNGNELQFASDRLKDNEQIVLEALKKDSLAFQFASNRLKDDEEFFWKIVLIENNGWSLQFVSDRLKDNEEFMLKAVKQYGYVLGYASHRLKDNEQIVLEAVKKDGSALGYAPHRFKDNEEIVLEAVKQDGYALCYASDRLKENEEIVLEAVKQNGTALRFTLVSVKDDILLEAIKQNGLTLKFAPDRFKDNEEIVLEAVKQSGHAVNFASDRLRNDFNFINEILKCCNSLQIFNTLAPKFRNIEFIYYYIENYESHFHELVRKT